MRKIVVETPDGKVTVKGATAEVERIETSTTPIPLGPNQQPYGDTMARDYTTVLTVFRFNSRGERFKSAQFTEWTNWALLSK